MVFLLIALTVCACGQDPQLPPQHTDSPIARLPGGQPSHLAVIVMENHEFDEVIGSGQAPFINRLARAHGLARRMFAITNPSLPNYLALTGGTTAGIDSDCTGCRVRGSGLAGQLSAAGISWKAYMEDMPRSCFRGSGHKGYAKKHDPFIYYTGVADDFRLCNNIVPLSQLRLDERRGTLPRFIWITPNLCHDMHDCDVRVGDRFLARIVPPLLRRLGRRGLLALTWDEGSSNAGCCRYARGGHIATIIAGAGARRRARETTPVDHYSLLQTIDDLFGLPRLGHAKCACTPGLRALLARR
jgi:hypothetical protein